MWFGTSLPKSRIPKLIFPQECAGSAGLRTKTAINDFS